MDCRECDFNIAFGGSCRGLKKNTAAKVPFYVCPFAAEVEQLEDYYDRPAVKRASHVFAIVIENSTTPGAHECRPAVK